MFNPYGNLFAVQQPVVPQTYAPQVSGGIKYVQSPESADSCSLAPNTSEIFFNQNVDEFYFVSADAVGTKTRRDFIFKEKEKASAPVYVTQEELQSLKDELLKRIGDIHEQSNE